MKESIDNHQALEDLNKISNRSRGENETEASNARLDKLTIISESFEICNKRCDNIDSRCIGIDKRCEGIENRCEGIDKRCEGIDKRCEGIEKTCENSESLFTSLLKLFCTKFDFLEKKIGDLEEKVRGVKESGDFTWRSSQVCTSENKLAILKLARALKVDLASI